MDSRYRQIQIDYPIDELSVLKAFPDRSQLKKIVNESRDFKDQFPGTFNGIILGNPAISLPEDGSLAIKAERLHYQTYFAAHELRKDKAAELGENYCALSICGIVYDTSRRSFYLSIRPNDSQEDPGKIDAPGGVLSPEFANADPFKTAGDRFDKKLGLNDLKISSIGIEKIFDDKYSVYNIAMYSEVANRQPAVADMKYKEIQLAKAEEYLKSDQLTAPARATLLLALSQDKFKEYGWGKERIEKIMKN